MCYAPTAFPALDIDIAFIIWLAKQVSNNGTGFGLWFLYRGTDNGMSSIPYRASSADNDQTASEPATVILKSDSVARQAPSLTWVLGGTTTSHTIVPAWATVSTVPPLSMTP